MISKYGHSVLATFKVVLPVLECFDYCEQLSIMYLVLGLDIGHFLRPEYDRMLLVIIDLKLANDRTDCMS